MMFKRLLIAASAAAALFTVSVSAQASCCGSKSECPTTPPAEKKLVTDMNAGDCKSDSCKGCGKSGKK